MSHPWWAKAGGDHDRSSVVARSSEQRFGVRVRRPLNSTSRSKLGRDCHKQRLRQCAGQGYRRCCLRVDLLNRLLIGRNAGAHFAEPQPSDEDRPHRRHLLGVAGVVDSEARWRSAPDLRGLEGGQLAVGCLRFLEWKPIELRASVVDVGRQREGFHRAADAARLPGCRDHRHSRRAGEGGRMSAFAVAKRPTAKKLATALPRYELRARRLVLVGFDA